MTSLSTAIRQTPTQSQFATEPFEWSPRSAATRDIERLTREIVNHVEKDLHSSAEAKAANG